jgi:glycosyltransferase involved in cell wall biosynthesis
VHLLLAGRPPDTHSDSVVYDARLRKYALETALSRNVHFLGWRSDVPDLLQASDIYVSTSYGEALADALREAMAAGKSMVVTDVGGTSELVANGRCGFLFEPGDVQALVKYLTELIRDSKLRAAMGLEGKRIIESNFSTEAYARKFEDMVSAVIR